MGWGRRNAWAVGLAWLGCAAATLAAAPDRPNVLYILVDDFGSRDLGCYGSTIFRTPNMDALAKDGARFTQAYVAYPRCVPSRFAILTGKHPAPFQKNRDSVHVEAGRDTTFGEPFQAAGYETFYCGKWHLGEGASLPGKRGFGKTVAAGAAGATRSHFAPYSVAKRAGGKNEEKDAVEGLDDAPKGECLADRLTDETAAFIRSRRDRPFLAVLAHYAVHTPIEGKPDLAEAAAARIKAANFPAPAYEPEGAGENLLVQNNAAYAAMVESVDQSVGKLRKLLAELQLDGNTIVVLASDHGGLSARGGRREVATSNRPLRAGKGHLYEGGLRIPLLIHWPGRTKPASVIDTPVVSMDLFPTFLDMAGVPAPAGPRDGVSLAKLLGAGAALPARDFFWHNPAPRPQQTGDNFSSALRRGDLKLIEYPETKRVELYDLAADPGEAHDLAARRPADRDRLLAALHAWKKSVGAGDAPRKKKNR